MNLEVKFRFPQFTQISVGTYQKTLILPKWRIGKTPGPLKGKALQ
jgi:hypothetical protein